MITVYDRVTIEKPRITSDGYLVGDAPVARTGIQNYLASELGMDGDPNRVIRVYRSPEEVFAADSLASYAHRPITDTHPKEMVDSKNWKKYSKGQTGGEVMRDGDMVRVPLVLMDQAAIDQYNAGKKELSMGYKMNLEVIGGVTDSGEEYDAVMRDMRMNHLALVPRARGGSQLKLGDSNQGGSVMSETKTVTVTVDGLSVETTDAGAQAISKLQKDLAQAATKLNDTESQHKEQIAAKDREIATKDATIDDLKGKVLDEAALDARVKERADLIAVAKKVADKDYSGQSNDQIRKTAVVEKLGQGAVDGKSTDYIAARFDHLVEAADADPVRRVLRTVDNHTAVDGAEKAYDSMCNRYEDAWKGGESA